MGSCTDIREEFSAFHDNSLDAEMKKRVAAHVVSCPDCAAEYRSFARTLDVIRAIPVDEPVIDMWAEIAPHLDQIDAEKTLTLAARVRCWWLVAQAGLSEGAIMFTHRLAETTTKRFSKYLTRDPFSAK